MIAADPIAMAGPWFSVEIVPARTEVWLRLTGELDLAAAPKLNEPVGELLAAGFRQLVIDLRRVTFIDVAGVRLLLKQAHDACNDGWQLSLIQGHGQVRRMLTLAGVTGQLPFRTASAEHARSATGG